MTEDKNTEVQETFDGICHVVEHDQRGGEFLIVEKIDLLPSKKSKGDVLVIFKFRGLAQLRAVRSSPDNLDKALKDYLASCSQR